MFWFRRADHERIISAQDWCPLSIAIWIGHRLRYGVRVVGAVREEGQDDLFVADTQLAMKIGLCCWKPGRFTSAPAERSFLTTAVWPYYWQAMNRGVAPSFVACSTFAPLSVSSKTTSGVSVLASEVQRRGASGRRQTCGQRRRRADT